MEKTVTNRFVVAVSGGIDSVVLLHLLQQLPDVELIVAHFDHGIREDSSNDARLVEELAKKYNLPFRTKREELGPDASESLARKRRYEFLQSLADEYDAKIVTAHHSDDAIETVAINHTRGTGWRGLAVLDSDVVRPLIAMDKSAIRHYAQRYNLEWHEDSTNLSDKYLRNRLRRKTATLADDDKKKLLSLRRHQLSLKKQIDDIVKTLAGERPDYSRDFFTYMPSKVAIEVLRFVTKGLLTRPQLERAVQAIGAARSGATFQAGNGIEFHFTSRHFTVELIK